MFKFSIRFYLRKGQVPAEGWGEITRTLRNVGRYVYSQEELDYYECRNVSEHLFAVPNEFIPAEFQRLIRPYLAKVTIMGYMHGVCHDSPIVTVGSTTFNFDGTKVFITGVNLQIIAKAAILLQKYNGKVPATDPVENLTKKLARAEKTISEFRAALQERNETIKNLKGELIKKEKQLETPCATKKPFWKLW